MSTLPCFQNIPQKFALPSGMSWKLLLDTAKEESIPREPETLGVLREITLSENSVCLLAGIPEKKPDHGTKKHRQAGRKGEDKCSRDLL